MKAACCLWWRVAGGVPAVLCVRHSRSSGLTAIFQLKCSKAMRCTRTCFTGLDSLLKQEQQPVCVASSLSERCLRTTSEELVFGNAPVIQGQAADS